MKGRLVRESRGTVTHSGVKTLSYKNPASCLERRSTTTATKGQAIHLIKGIKGQLFTSGGSKVGDNTLIVIPGEDSSSVKPI